MGTERRRASLRQGHTRPAAVLVLMANCLAALPQVDAPKDAPQVAAAGAAAPAAEADAASPSVWESFAILQLVGSGNTLRAGPKRLLLRRFLAQLQRRLGDQAIAPETLPVLDQAITALGFCELQAASNYSAMRMYSDLCVKALAASLDRGPTTTEVAAIAELVLRCRRNAAAHFVVAPDRANPVPFDASAKLAASLAAARVQPPSTLAEIAAEHLRRRLRGRAIPAADAARPWPSPAHAEPMVTLYLELADYRPEDAEWQQASRARGDALEALRHRQEPNLGTWDPVGREGTALGRDGVTAILDLALQLHHRGCRLSCLQGL